MDKLISNQISTDFQLKKPKWKLLEIWHDNPRRRETTYYHYYQLQHGLCAACHKGSKRRLHLDHDHKTLKIRGLLCYKCNFALGFTGDSVKRLLDLAFYLKRTANT